LRARDYYLMDENKPDAPTPAQTITKALAEGSLIGAQAGCVSVGLVILALVVGLLLDQALGTKPMFVLGLLLLSIPVSLYAMVRSVLASTRARKPPSTAAKPKKEDESLE
jgi:F0F1-type ATP synthase assembly protein I